MKRPKQVATRLAASAIAISMIAMPQVTNFTPTAFLNSAGLEVTASAASNSYCESRASDGFFVVTAESLNVRKGAGTGYARCGSLPEGTIIHWTGKQSNGFIQIDTGKYHGRWVSRSYLQAAYFERGVSKVRTSGSNRLILRKGPGKSFSEITRIPNGTTLGTSYHSKGWSYVFYTCGSKAYGGWVSDGYLVKQSVTHR